MTIRFTKFGQQKWWFINLIAYHQATWENDLKIQDYADSASMVDSTALATEEEIRDLITTIWTSRNIEDERTTK
jgi:hypothetical protein